MGLDERLIEIAEAFFKFIQTGKKSLIESFTREEIEMVGAAGGGGLLTHPGMAGGMRG